MIKVGILGAETTDAGELIRILINHPDVELKTVASDTEAGRDVTSLHRGLTGDTDQKVAPASALTPEGLDAVFLCGEAWMATQWMQTHDEAARNSNTRIIDLTGAFRNGAHEMVYGFPEHNRKALVRGATRASVPSAAAMVTELSLFPLAKNGTLVDDILTTVHIADTPAAAMRGRQLESVELEYNYLATSTRLDPTAPAEHRLDAEDAANEATMEMRSVQASFSNKINMRLSRDNSLSRGICAESTVPCAISLQEIRRLYEEAYVDHRFTFIVDNAPCIADVANTNKCLLHLNYRTETGTGLPMLRITAVMDNLLKGAAGTAVHCLNLLFGLSECTGLALKASAF